MRIPDPAAARALFLARTSVFGRNGRAPRKTEIGRDYSAALGPGGVVLFERSRGRGGFLLSPFPE